MLSQRPINYLRICSYFTIFSLILSMQNNKSLLFSRTKNVPWHILAPSAVVYDFLPLRASAHPAGGFLSYRKAISYTIKKLPHTVRQLFCELFSDYAAVINPERLLRLGKHQHMFRSLHKHLHRSRTEKHLQRLHLLDTHQHMYHS